MNMMSGEHLFASPTVQELGSSNETGGVFGKKKELEDVIFLQT